MLGRTNVGGGGDCLDFKVVSGTTQPANPAENTIWVNTDQEITGWVFSVEEPESPANGEVWFTTGAFGPALNALEENGIILRINNCKQYVNGGWQIKKVSVYQDGWISTELVLFDIGSASDTSMFTTISDNVISLVAGEYLETKNTSSHKTTTYYVQDVDLTGYNILSATGYASTTGGEKLIIAPAGSTEAEPDVIANVNFPTSQNTVTIDVTNLSGLYKVGLSLRAYSTRYIRITNLKLSI